MLANYFPVLLFLAIGAAVGIGGIVASGILARVSGAQNPPGQVARSGWLAAGMSEAGTQCAPAQAGAQVGAS